MKIWVDADACPKLVKEVLYRAADREQIDVTFVANQPLSTPPSRYLHTRQVPKGFDVADDEIVQQLAAGDLVITADIPLADEVIGQGGLALNPRGTLYNANNIKDHLQRRDMMEQLRSDGVVAGGPPAYDKRDLQQFANALDRVLRKR